MTKKIYTLTIAVALTMVVGLTANADTIFTGTATDNIYESGSWDNGLPTSSGNVGTINSDANWFKDTTTLTDYYLDVTGGTIQVSGFNNTGWAFAGGQQTLNGGSLNTTRTFLLSGDAAFTVNNAASTAYSDESGGTSILRMEDTSQFILNSGLGDFGDGVHMIDSGASFKINGGSFVTGNANSVFGTPNFSGGGAAFFNGGTLSADFLNFRHAWTLTLGGSTTGSATFSGFGGSSHNDNNISVDWLTGSQMELSVTNANWETLWNAGSLTYNGQGTNELSKSWAEVTSSGGLGGGENFSLDGETLKVIPEPAVMSLVASAGLLMLLVRRRMGK